MPQLRHSYGLNHLHYVTTSIPQGGMGFRIVGYVLIPQGGTVTYCSGPRTAPTPPSPLVAQGPRSGPFAPLRAGSAALPATRVLAAAQTGQCALGLAPRRIRFLKTSKPRRQNHGAVEKPQGCRASLALHILPAGPSRENWLSVVVRGAGLFGAQVPPHTYSTPPYRGQDGAF